MRHPRFFTTPLLISLVASGCDAESEPVDSEQQLDMSLLEQDEDGNWYAPIAEGAPSSLSNRSDPSGTYFPMHNHLTGISGIYSYWSIHRNGGHGTVCGLEGDFIQQCANISAYVGASNWGINSMTYCGGDFPKNAGCTVW